MRAWLAKQCLLMSLRLMGDTLSRRLLLWHLDVYQRALREMCDRAKAGGAVGVYRDVAAGRISAEWGAQMLLELKEGRL